MNTPEFKSKNKPFLINRTLDIKGKIMDLSLPKVMGIINITPDSFHRINGKEIMKNGNIDIPLVISIAGQMIEDGADIIDIGGASSRPGAKQVSAKEELQRVIPVIEKLVERSPEIIVSIDTYHASVAEAAIDAGASIINDISAGSIDSNMISTAAKLDVPYILMHMKGTPFNMQDNPHYDNLILEITDFFLEKIRLLKDAGLTDIILDPGFGFGKTLEHNYEILRNMDYFQALNLPMLVGISRKSMINKVLDTLPENALNGTSAIHMLALNKGAKMLRVHDVKEAKEVIKIWNYYDAAI